MKFLQAITDDGKTEFFNLNRILTMTPSENGERVKILLAPNMYWWVWHNSIKIVDFADNDFPQKITREGSEGVK